MHTHFGQYLYNTECNQLNPVIHYSKMVNDLDSPEVQPHLEVQGVRSCLEIPVHYRSKKTIITLTVWNKDKEMSDLTSYSQSLLSVQDVQAIRLSLQVPEAYTDILNIQHRTVRREYNEKRDVWCMSSDLQEGPLVLGNLLVPEALADPKAKNKCLLINNQLALVGTDMCCWLEW